MVFGSMPNEGGNLLLSDDEFNELKSKNSEANFIKFIKPFIGAKEFIKGEKRWCIWLKDIDHVLMMHIHILKLFKKFCYHLCT